MFRLSTNSAYGALHCRQLVVAINSKNFATKSEIKPNNADAIVPPGIDVKSAKPFSSIPGPTKLELIRSMFPGGLLYKKLPIESIMIMHEKYGPLLRFPGLFGKPDTYMDLNPEDYPIIFRNEGKWPERRELDSLKYYREVYRKDFFEGVEGIAMSSGEKWSKGRTATNPILMQNRNVIPYLNAMQDVNEEFLIRIREIRDPATQEMPDTFEDEIHRLAFESVAIVALDSQLGLINKNRDSAETEVLISTVRRVFDLAYDLDILPSIWKFVKTPKFYQLMSTMDTLIEILSKHINEAIVKFERKSKSKQVTDQTKERSILQKLSEIDKKFAVVMTMDLLFGGVDTTTSTLTGILLCIAKNPAKQEKLFEEIMQLLPQKTSYLTAESLRSMPYLRACIKEGIRMYPVLVGTMRKLPHDLVLSGYRVVKGTEVVMGSNMLLNNDEYVPQADKFLPERWLREETAEAITNPFVYLPFGFGPRMCAGKRIVDLELQITIARLVRNFKIEFNYSTENAFVLKMFNVPNIPLKFKFQERNND